MIVMAHQSIMNTVPNDNVVSRAIARYRRGNSVED
jgi:hypothetical protein